MTKTKARALERQSAKFQKEKPERSKQHKIVAAMNPVEELQE